MSIDDTSKHMTEDFYLPVDDAQEATIDLTKWYIMAAGIGAFSLAVLGVLAFALLHVNDITLDDQRIWGYLTSLTEQTASGRLGELFNRIAEYGIWSYFTDPYILGTTGIITAAMLMDVAGHAWKKRSWANGWRSSALYRVVVERSRSSQNDLILFIYNRLSLYLIVMPLVALLGPIFIYYLLLKSFDFNLLAGMEDGLFKFLIFVVVTDFSYYLCHVLVHKNKALWEIHKFHHSCTEMNIITGTRDHPFEKAVQKLFSAFPLVLLGAPVEHYFAILILQYAHGIFTHSDWDISFGPLDKIFISPRMHRIHHSVKTEHWDLNYGVIFSVWDHMFGTAYKGKDYVPEVDVTDNYFNQKGFWHDMIMPLVKCFRQAFKAPLESN